MKRLILLLLLAPFAALADGPAVGPDCTFTWTPSATGELATGFKMYVGASATSLGSGTDVGNVTTIKCSQVSVTTAGQYYAAVSAYNVAGEGGKSNIVPFVLVKQVPNPPTLNVQ